MFYSKAILYFNDHADDLSLKYNSTDRTHAHAGLIKLLPKSKKLKILDVGAGSGADASMYADMEHDVVAVEPAWKLRKIAKKTFKNSRIKWIADKLPQLKLINVGIRKFDVVYCANALQYLKEKDRAQSLLRMVSFLKDGGLLEIQYPSPPSREYQFPINSNEIKNFVKQYNEPISRHSQLKIFRKTRSRASGGRKALDGSDLYFNTIIIKVTSKNLKIL